MSWPPATVVELDVHNESWRNWDETSEPMIRVRQTVPPAIADLPAPALPSTTTDALARAEAAMSDFARVAGYPMPEYESPAEVYQEMADLIGSTRETVTTVLADFKRQGLIDSRSHHFVVIDRDALTANVDSETAPSRIKIPTAT